MVHFGCYTLNGNCAANARVRRKKKTETNDDGRRTMDVKDLHLEETRLMDYQHKLDCIQFIYILLIPQTILCVVSVCV